MAENEKKTELVKEAKPAKEEKSKQDKPSVFARLGLWFKSLKSECKKISWASWKSVQSNSAIVLVSVVIISIVLGLLDYCLSNAVVGLNRLI